MTLSQLKYKFDHFYSFAQTDGLTFIQILLRQFERRKKYENDNYAPAIKWQGGI